MMIRAFIGISSFVLLTSSAGLAADGAAIYKAQCSKCHGDTGQADTGIAKAMKVPALAGDANLQKMSAADVATRIKTNTKHPPNIKSLSADDVNAVAAYVKQLAGK